jgi:hypothetical protein
MSECRAFLSVDMSTVARHEVGSGGRKWSRRLIRADAAASIPLLERGMGRELGPREYRPDPLRVEDLERLVATSRDSVRDCRDRALLLVGFARRSLAAAAPSVCRLQAVPVKMPNAVRVFASMA